MLLVVCLPLAVRALPASDQDIDAADLLARIEASETRAFSGYVESRGNLQLPVADRFTDVGALFGQQTRMRVWWRGTDDWRVDKLLASGETDLVRGPITTVEWSYEKADVTTSVDPAIRLPRSADLLPPAVARLLLQDVDPAELTRLPARRVAGRDGLGLRLSPAAPQSSIDHVDLWADAVTGIPLRVDVYAAPDSTTGTRPALTSEFRSFSDRTPSPQRTGFSPPPGADREFDDVLDIADAANQYAPVLPPEALAGLTRSPAADRAVGIYGTGVTRVFAIPMRGREAGPLREQLLLTPGVEDLDEGTLVQVGPLGVLLTGFDDSGGWLVAGTVTRAALLDAAHDLAVGVRLLPEGD